MNWGLKLREGGEKNTEEGRVHVKLVDESPALISNYWEMEVIYLGVEGERGGMGVHHRPLFLTVRHQKWLLFRFCHHWGLSLSLIT